MCFRTQYQFWKKRVEWLRFPQLWPVRFCGFFQWKTERMLWNALLLFYYWIAISEWSEWLWDEISKTLDSYSRLYVQLFRKQSQIGGKFSMKYGPEKHWELNIDSTVVSKLAMKSQFFLVKSKRILWKTFFHFSSSFPRLVVHWNCHICQEDYNILYRTIILSKTSLIINNFRLSECSSISFSRNMFKF